MTRFGKLAVAAGSVFVVTAMSGAAQAADAWSVDADASTLAFVATQGGQEFTGQFESWQADIAFSPDDLAGSQVTVTIDMSTADAGANDRNSQLPTGDWFDVDNHPTATFVTTGFAHVDGDDYQATADLTIKGVTLPVTLPFSLTIEGNTATVSGALTLLRTDYSVGEGQWSSGDTVGLDVRVEVDLTATRQ